MKILLADDDPLASRALQSYLDALGYVVVTAADGEQALHSFAAEHPDMVLLDVDMPITDGFEVARNIRATEGHGWIPIIFLSGQGEPAMIAAGIEAGGDDYLVKPVSLKVLLAKIEALQRITRQQDPVSPQTGCDAHAEGNSSIEIRWFFPASAALRRPLLFANTVPAVRIDWYAAPGHQSCGIKQREGCLELKLRLKSLGRQAFADASGVLEQWCKWSLPLAEVPAAPDLQTTGWTAVEKTRFLVYFCIRSDNVQQLDQCPEHGYQFEWTELKVQGQHWLTMGLETLGDSSKLADRFSSVLEHIAPQLDHYPLDTTHSYAYPDWLSQLR